MAPADPAGPGPDPAWEVRAAGRPKGGSPDVQFLSKIRSDDEEVAALLSALIDGAAIPSGRSRSGRPPALRD